jgi:hypothetical protein
MFYFVKLQANFHGRLCVYTPVYGIGAASGVAVQIFNPIVLTTKIHFPLIWHTHVYIFSYAIK